MTTITRYLFSILLLSIVACAEANAQTTIRAASCNESDVQTALGKVSTDGSIVAIPAGNCTWTTPLQATLSHSLTIQGAGAESATDQGASTTGTDQTTIQDGINHSSGDPSVMSFTTTAGKTFRLTGIAFVWNSSNTTTTYSGELRIAGASQSVRIDHCHFSHISNVSVQIVGEVEGVLDHCVFDLYAASGVAEGVKFDGTGWNGGTGGNGDASWADSSHFGSSQFFFVEDSQFNGGSSAANDCYSGGRWVIRYSTLNGSSVQTHPTGGSGRGRGCRAWELYKNTFNGSNSNPNYNAFFLSSGTGVIWGNSAPAGYEMFVSLHSMRKDNSTYTQQPTPNGWGYCGTAFNGTGSNWDQNTNASTGYACLDQPGRGKGDLLSGQFPNAVDTVTGTISWPNEALEPIYEWLDSWTPVPGYPYSFLQNSAPAVEAENRDYYLNNSSFTGAEGVGSGLLSDRPSSCTPRVGYWATDANNGNGELYVCTTPNTWTPYYTPYTYPHPLDTTSTSDIPADLHVTSVR